MAALLLCSPDSHRQASWSVQDLQVRRGSRLVSRGLPFSAGSCLHLLSMPSAATLSKHRQEGEHGLIVVTLRRNLRNQQAGVALSCLDPRLTL